MIDILEGDSSFFLVVVSSMTIGSFDGGWGLPTLILVLLLALKYRVSPILDSLNIDSKGPVQLQTGTDHSFLGFEFRLSWTHPKDELIIKQMLSSSRL